MFLNVLESCYCYEQNIEKSKIFVYMYEHHPKKNLGKTVENLSAVFVWNNVIEKVQNPVPICC